MFSAWCIACGQERSKREREREREREKAIHPHFAFALTCRRYTNVCYFVGKNDPTRLGVASCVNRALKGRKGIIVEWTNDEKRASEASDRTASAMARGVGICTVCTGCRWKGWEPLTGAGGWKEPLRSPPLATATRQSRRVTRGERISCASSALLRFFAASSCNQVVFATKWIPVDTSVNSRSQLESRVPLARFKGNAARAIGRVSSLFLSLSLSLSRVPSAF